MTAEAEAIAGYCSELIDMGPVHRSKGFHCYTTQLERLEAIAALTMLALLESGDRWDPSVAEYLPVAQQQIGQSDPGEHELAACA
jgi:hypothetical protein